MALSIRALSGEHGLDGIPCEKGIYCWYVYSGGLPLEQRFNHLRLVSIRALSGEDGIPGQKGLYCW